MLKREAIEAIVEKIYDLFVEAEITVEEAEEVLERAQKKVHLTKICEESKARKVPSIMLEAYCNTAELGMLIPWEEAKKYITEDEYEEVKKTYQIERAAEEKK